MRVNDPPAGGEFTLIYGEESRVYRGTTNPLLEELELMADALQYATKVKTLEEVAQEVKERCKRQGKPHFADLKPAEKLAIEIVDFQGCELFE